MKKLDKKGFTLIEMVIVIVIIAILAAILVPSLLAYVDSANEKKLMSAGDTLKKAILTEVSEMSKEGEDINNKSTDDVFGDDFWEYLSSTAGVTVREYASTDDAKYKVKFEIKNNAILEIKVTDGEKAVELKNGAWVTAEK